jgi:TolA-binding protein
LTPKGGFTGLEGEELKPMEWKAPEPGSLSLKKGGRWQRVSYRRFWLLRPDTGNAGQALQLGNRTWFKATEEDLPELVAAAEAGGKGKPKEIRTRLAAPLLTLLPDTQAGALSAARLDVLAGRAKKGIDGLQKVIKAKKKAPAETWFWLGEAFLASRKKPEAKKAFKAYLEKAPKRGAHVKAAQARLDAK